ncbi:tetratricopeptide repeat protein [Bacteroidota bacterium]
MNQSGNTKSDKFSLIYEFDDSSPLFARVAQSYLNNMEIEQAVDILVKGIAKYPDYPSAYIIYAKAQAIRGKKDHAIQLITKASEIVAYRDTYDLYLKEIDKISREHANFNSDLAKDFVPDQFDKEEGKDEFLPNLDELDSDSDIEKGIDLDVLSEEISKAKIPKVSGMVDFEEEAKLTFDEGKIVSETLAQIYFSQGNYKEAIQTYRELIINNPARMDEFNKKIDEIKDIMKNDSD